MAQAMVRLVLDRPLAARLGANARETALALSWDRELDRLDQSYRQIIGGPETATVVASLPERETAPNGDLAVR